VVGESGSGKSTLGRMIGLIEKPLTGELELDGADAIKRASGTATRLRRTVQFVFQNPYGSLNPRKKIGAILTEPLIINTDLTRKDRIAKAQDMMARVGLRPEHYTRYPHMFSGGQRQRIAIARALILDPKLVVADEPISALDVSIQAQVLNLLADLQRDTGVAYLFISHDLTVVGHIAHNVLVLYLGVAVEQGPKTVIFDRPLHPYTQALLASTPVTTGTKRHRQDVYFPRVALTLPTDAGWNAPLHALSQVDWSPAIMPKNFCRRCRHDLPACVDEEVDVETSEAPDRRSQ